MSQDTLVQLQGASWVITGPTTLGLLVMDDEVVLLDSGNDKDAGRKVNRLLKERNWHLRAIINTHSNADHIGANDYFQRQTGCQIWAPQLEVPFIEHPELEAYLLWGGMPVKEMQSKFFQAKPSKVTGDVRALTEIAGTRIETIDLPGHFVDMVGIMTEDKVLYLGDCMFGEEILEKYKIPFVFDVTAYKSTINRVRTMPADYYVLCHGGVTTDITGIAEANLAVILRLESFLTELLGTRMGYDDILQHLCDCFGIALDYGQYALVGSTLRSFLSFLYNEGRISYEFSGNRMLWSVGG